MTTHAANNAIRRLPAFETRFLQRTPGNRLKTYQKQTENNMKTKTKILKKSVPSNFK